MLALKSARFCSFAYRAVANTSVICLQRTLPKYRFSLRFESPLCPFSTSRYFAQENVIEDVSVDTENIVEQEPVTPDYRKKRKDTERGFFTGKEYEPSDLATSLEYMKSEAYQDVYRNKPVWHYYRRNFKGHYPPPRTRRSCVINGKLSSGNPCPICRDEHLILHYRHTELLRQFVDPLSGEVLPTKVTGLCRRQDRTLHLELEKAREIGSVEIPIPMRVYDYKSYFPSVPEALVQDFSEVRIPYAQAVEVRPDESVIDAPNVPNRYELEEGWKVRKERKRKKN